MRCNLKLYSCKYDKHCWQFAYAQFAIVSGCINKQKQRVHQISFMGTQHPDERTIYLQNTYDTWNEHTYYKHSTCKTPAHVHK